MTAERISDYLNRLNRHLTTLDHGEIESCISELDGLRDALPAECLSGAELAVLMFQIRQAKHLATAAAELYSGWMNIAQPPALAYAPRTLDRSAPAPSGTLALEA